VNVSLGLGVALVSAGVLLTMTPREPVDRTNNVDRRRCLTSRLEPRYRDLSEHSERNALVRSQSGV